MKKKIKQKDRYIHCFENKNQCEVVIDLNKEDHEIVEYNWKIEPNEIIQQEEIRKEFYYFKSFFVLNFIEQFENEEKLKVAKRFRNFFSQRDGFY